MAVINPPNTPLVDSQGRLTPEWYRFFVSLNRDVSSNTTIVVDQTIFGDGQTPIIPDASSDISSDAVFTVAPVIEAETTDTLFPPAIEPDPFDPSPYTPAGQASYLNTRTITATGSPAATDYLLLVDATGGPVTVNYPAASASAKRVLIVKKIDASANAVTIDPNGAETIDGAATKVLSTQYSSLTTHCDGTQWWLT